jgi:hypothetical protein
MSLDGVSGIIDSATQTISSVSKAVNTFVSTGPASGLSSALSGISGAFSGFGNFFKGLAAGQQLPLPNPLFAYASYTYVLGIGILSEEDLNYPDKTYKKGKRIPLICKDANADPSNRVNTVYGKFDFFVNNVELNSVIGFEQGGGNTNVMNFSFDVIEPYSMGLFMLSLQQGAQEQGWDNWRECPFVLTIDFRGNTETGLIKSIPNTARQIPFSFVDLQMTANEKGSVYKCSAMPWNQLALTDDVANTKSDSSAVGSTIQEILQSGENSLQKVLNARMKEMEKQKIVDKADEYLILFPQDTASSADASQSDDNTEDTKSSATESVTDSPNAVNLYSSLGVSRSKTNQTLVQSEGDCNDIGKASLGFDEKRKGDPSFGKDHDMYDAKTGTFNPGKLKFDGSSTEMRFTQDTSIPQAINQVILQSNFVNTTLDSSKITPEGYRDWYRISHKVYTIGETQNNTGLKPRLIVYQVIPYKAHASRLLPAGTKGPGFENLKQQAVKKYEYIYTGHNVDIIRFDIKFVNGFVYIMGADGLTKTQDKVTGNQTGNQDPKTDENVKFMPDGKPPSKSLGVVPTILKWTNTLTGQDRKGGGGQEGEAQRAAKLFNQALNNPFDMYNLEMEIIGDPYYIAQSGTGNYTSEQATPNLNTDGSVNYESGEVDIIVNFRTPIDINQGTGLYNFGGVSKSAPVTQFSGLYCVQTIKSKFSDGKFTQVLTGFRRPTQEYEEEPTSDDLPATTRTVTSAPNTDSDTEESGT